MSASSGMTCSQCGGTAFALGYLGSSGSQDKGTFEQWYDGPLELTMFGDVKHASSRARYQVLAHRCEQCGHLELFTAPQS